MNHDPMPDDRLDRMMADPDAYFAEARARARELVERDLERDRRWRRRRRWCFLIHRWWVPTARVPTVWDSYFCVRCGETWSRP